MIEVIIRKPSGSRRPYFQSVDQAPWGLNIGIYEVDPVRMRLDLLVVDNNDLLTGFRTQFPGLSILRNHTLSLYDRDSFQINLMFRTMS